MLIAPIPGSGEIRDGHNGMFACLKCLRHLGLLNKADNRKWELASPGSIPETSFSYYLLYDCGEKEQQRS